MSDQNLANGELNSSEVENVSQNTSQDVAQSVGQDEVQSEAQSQAQDQDAMQSEALVAQWLLATPGFFNRHPELLTQIELVSSHNGRAISLQEKQMDVLRNQNRDLNRRMVEMLQFGVENDRTQSLMVKWLEELCSSKSQELVIENMTAGLNDMFSVGRVEYLSPVVAATKVNHLNEEILVGALPMPIPMPMPMPMTFSIPEGTYLSGSFAFVPLLNAAKSYGALLFLSEDPQKYSSQTGSIYLKQLGALAAAALSRFEAD